TTGRLEAALDDVDQWLASGDQHFFPLFYRAEVLERRGNLEAALPDYCAAAIRLAEDIVGHRSDRFRSLHASANRPRFEQALAAALALGNREAALGLLELMNTGGRAILASRRPAGSVDHDALDRIGRARASLLTAALAAIAESNGATQATCQDRAELL